MDMLISLIWSLHFISTSEYHIVPTNMYNYSVSIKNNYDKGCSRRRHWRWQHFIPPPRPGIETLESNFLARRKRKITSGIKKELTGNLKIMKEEKTMLKKKSKQSKMSTLAFREGTWLCRNRLSLKRGSNLSDRQ